MTSSIDVVVRKCEGGFVSIYKLWRLENSNGTAHWTNSDGAKLVYFYNTSSYYQNFAMPSRSSFWAEKSDLLAYENNPRSEDI